jgi:hypothetical protein
MDAVLELILNSAKYKAELQATMGLTERESAKMALALARDDAKVQAAAAGAARAQAALTTSTMTTTAAIKNLSGKGGALTRLAPMLMLVNAESGAASKMLAKVGKAALVFNSETLSAVTALGPYAVLLAAIGANAYIFYQNAQLAKREANEYGGAIHGMSLAAKDAEGYQRALAQSLTAAGKHSSDARTEMLVLTGQMTALEAQTRKATAALYEMYSPQFTASAKKLNDAQERAAAARANLEKVRGQGYTQGWLGRAQDAADVADLALADAEAEMAAARRNFDFQRRLEVQTIALTAAKRDGTKASREQREEDDAGLTALGRLYSEKIRMAEQAIRVSERQAAAEEAAEAARQRAAEQQVEDAQRLAAAEMEAKADLYYNVAGFAAAAADLMGQKDREAAMMAFRISKAAALVQVAINTQVAASKAAAQTGILAPIGIAAAFALGAAQAATIAGQSPPQFYAGGLLDDSRPAVLHRGEAVLNQRARSMLGDDTIRAANRGERQSQTVIVENAMDGRQIGAVVARQVRGGGRLTNEITRHVGRLGRA